MPPAAPTPTPTPHPGSVEIDTQPPWVRTQEDDSAAPPEQSKKKPAKPAGFKFSDNEFILVSFIAAAFGVIALAEVTAPFLGFIEAYYYKKKGLSNTVWLASFGVGALLGLIPILNLFVYVINFWIVFYV